MRKQAKQKREKKADAEPSRMLNLALVGALALIIWLMLHREPGPGPAPTPPGPDPAPVGEVTHALAIGGPAAVTLSTKVMDYCDQQGIEYRRTLPGDRPSGAEPEFETLYDKYESQSPCVGVLSRSGKTDRLTIPATADELIVYLQGDD